MVKINYKKVQLALFLQTNTYLVVMLTELYWTTDKSYFRFMIIKYSSI